MLTEYCVGQIKMAHQLGRTICQISEDLGVSRNAISACVKRGYKPAKYVRKASSEQAKNLRMRRQKLAKMALSTVKKGHREFPKFGSARKIRDAYFKEQNVKLSERTVQRDLKKSSLKPFKRQKKPTRCLKDVNRRREFARLAKTVDVKRVVFSDESWISCNENTGRVQWAKNRLEVLPREQKARVNVASVQVWAAIGYNYKSEIVIFPATKVGDDEKKAFRLNARGYIQRCLSKVVPELVRQKRIFQQDGARSHASKVTEGCLSRKGLEVLGPWPAGLVDDTEKESASPFPTWSKTS